MSYAIILSTLFNEIHRLLLSKFKYEQREQSVGTSFDLVFLILVILYIITLFTGEMMYMVYIRIILRGILISGCILLLSCCISRCDYSKYISKEDKKFSAYVSTIKHRRIFTLLLGVVCCVLLTPHMNFVQLIIFLPFKSYVSHSCQLLTKGMKANSESFINITNGETVVSDTTIEPKVDKSEVDSEVEVVRDNKSTRSNLERRNSMID